MNVLEINKLSFSYSDYKVISELDCKIGAGCLVALLGKNGCGKTTLFRCILGLLKAESGEIKINSTSVSDYSPSKLAAEITYIPQENYPVFNYRVFEVLVLGLISKLGVFSTPKEKDYEKAYKVLKDLDAEHLMEKRYKELSGGERQLVLIARSLLQGSKLLIMDEPTANLDYGNQIKILNYLKELSRKGYSIIFSTHNPEHALLYCDETIVMHDRKIIAQGSPKAVLSKELLKTVYGIDLILKTIDTDDWSYDIVLPDTMFFK